MSKGWYAIMDSNGFIYPIKPAVYDVIDNVRCKLRWDVDELEARAEKEERKKK